MGKYFLCWEGKVYDYHFKTRGENNFEHLFYCGDIFMGQIFQMNKGKSRESWSAVPREPSPYGPYDGFRTRMDAAEMILKVNGYRRKEL